MEVLEFMGKNITTKEYYDITYMMNWIRYVLKEFQSVTNLEYDLLENDKNIVDTLYIKVRLIEEIYLMELLVRNETIEDIIQDYIIDPYLYALELEFIEE